MDGTDEPWKIARDLTQKKHKYKTDRSRHAHEEYRTQLSVYYHALDDWFDDREITASVYYTAVDERVVIDPCSKVELLGGGK